MNHYFTVKKTKSSILQKIELAQIQKNIAYPF